jgi:hypothetical protein
MAEAYDINDILGIEPEDDDVPEGELSVEEILGVDPDTVDPGMRQPTLRQLRWLALYTDHTRKDTFSNATASARVAGYGKHPHDAGKANVRKFRKVFTQWFTDQDLGKERVFAKVQFFAFEGGVTDERTTEALDIQLGAVKAYAELLGMKVERKIIEGGDNPIRHAHEVILSPEIQAKLGEIYGE